MSRKLQFDYHERDEAAVFKTAYAWNLAPGETIRVLRTIALDVERIVTRIDLIDANGERRGTVAALARYVPTPGLPTLEQVRDGQAS